MAHHPIQIKPESDDEVFLITVVERYHKTDPLTILKVDCDVQLLDDANKHIEKETRGNKREEEKREEQEGTEEIYLCLHNDRKMTFISATVMMEKLKDTIESQKKVKTTVIIEHDGNVGQKICDEVWITLSNGSSFLTRAFFLLILLLFFFFYVSICLLLLFLTGKEAQDRSHCDGHSRPISCKEVRACVRVRVACAHTCPYVRMRACSCACGCSSCPV